MHDNMTNQEQLKWVIQETGRQIAAAAHWTFIESIQSVHQAIFIEAPWAIRQAIKRRRDLREKLENLTNEGLIDRALAAPQVVNIPVQDTGKSYEVPVRHIIRRVLSIDGILAR